MDGLIADFHNHTNASHDGVTSPRRLIELARERGIDRIAVTDHRAIHGALRAREIDPERVIVGQEVRARCGTELIGLYLESQIPDGLALEEVAARIRGQGGLVYAPHPYAYFTKGAWRASRSIPLSDIVETINSRAFWAAWNCRAQEDAKQQQKGRGAGSDAHLPHEIGRAVVKMKSFIDAESLRKAIPSMEPQERGRALPTIHLHGYGYGYSRRTWWAMQRWLGEPRTLSR